MLAIGLESGHFRLLLIGAGGTVAIAVVIGGVLPKIVHGDPTPNAIPQAQPTLGQGQPSPPPALQTIDARPYLTITRISGDVLKKDYEASRFQDMIVISPSFKNVGSKAIVGVQGRISMIDGFGNEVYGFSFRLDQKIGPGEVYDTGGYQFEGNDYSEDDPYHKMLPLVNGGTAKYKWAISRIAFEDGSKIPK